MSDEDDKVSYALMQRLQELQDGNDDLSIEQIRELVTNFKETAGIKVTTLHTLFDLLVLTATYVSKKTEPEFAIPLETVGTHFIELFTGEEISSEEEIEEEGDED